MICEAYDKPCNTLSIYYSIVLKKLKYCNKASTGKNYINSYLWKTVICLKMVFKMIWQKKWLETSGGKMVTVSTC